jgi:hypothetical protein
MTTEHGGRRPLAFCDRHTAARAIELARPLLEQAVRTQLFGESGALHVVIMDPGADPGTTAFEDAILHEASFGERERWDWDYAGAARAKARLAWRTGRDGSALHGLAPHLLRRGDTRLEGGVWVDGIAVGVSGAHPWFDEALGSAVAAMLRAIARERAAHASGPYLE